MISMNFFRVSILLTLLFFFPSGQQLWAAEDLLPEDSGLLWLVNPEHPLEASYRPAKLVHVSGYPIRPEAGAAFTKMAEDMKAAGIRGLRLQSGYRPYRYQQALFNEKVSAWQSLGHKEEVAKVLAARSVAMPGASEHQIGLAVDVSLNGYLSVDFGDTEAGIWLQSNSDRYGYIIRYPKEKTALTRIIYEPWHLRYVGIPHAAYMNEHNMCLEEYISHLKEAGILLHWLDEENYYKISFVQNKPDTLKNLKTYNISSIGPESGEGFIITELKTFKR